VGKIISQLTSICFFTTAVLTRIHFQ